MRLIAPKIAMSALLGAALLVGSAWWLLRARPSLEGAAGRIAVGQFQAAERQLRDYLVADPGDGSARLLLARVLVDRPEPDPETALTLVGGLGRLGPDQAATVAEIEGDAHFWLGRYDRAEAGWLEALRLDPTLPEVGWKVLNIDALQGRAEDSRALALRLFATEPDERDRVQLLLQSIRLDVHPIEPASIVHGLGPIVQANPADLRSSTALGLALIGVGRAAESLDLLRRSIRSHGDDLAARLAYLDALIATGEVDELAKALDELPRSMADSPRFDPARGWRLAQSRDLDGAARCYRRALEVRPTPAALAYTALAHRFKNLLRQADRAAELAELGPRLEAIINFPVVARGFFDRFNSLPDLGLRSHPEEFEQLAEVLRRVGREDEANAWWLLARSAGRAAK